MRKLSTALLLTVLLFTSCIEEEQYDKCIELNKEYKELLFKATHSGNSKDKSIFEFWLQENQKALEACK